MPDDRLRYLRDLCYLVLHVIRFLLTIVTVILHLPFAGCDRSSPISILDKTASEIFDGEIAADENGVCKIAAKNNAVGNNAYVTTQPDGTKLVLFRTWQGKGSNLRGFLYTDGPPLTVGSTIEVSTFSPTGPNGRAPVAKQDVSIDSAVTKSCCRVSFSLD